MAKKVFAVDPPVLIEILNQGALGDVAARVDIGTDGSWEVTFDFFGGQGAWEDHGLRILQAAGRDDITTVQQAAALLFAKPKEEIDVLVKDAWNAMLKILCDLINLKWRASGQQPTSANYPSFEDMIAAQLAKTQGSVVDGKLVLKIP